MRHHHLRDLAKNPDLISGIYNYCDRWCERCQFTSRCLLYATERADPDHDDPETRDITNEKFWKKMHEIFAETAEMISEWAAEAGVDLNAVDISEEMAEHERAQEAARQSEISQIATKYADEVRRWLREEFITEQSVHSDAAVAEHSGEVDIAITDAIEVIQWYQFFIAVKLMRALSGAASVNEDYLDNEEFLTFDITAPQDADEDDIDYDEIIAKSSMIDANGSAKTALVAIDRSIAAWRFLLLSLPEKADTVKPLIIQLDRLRGMVEARLPMARDFIRPGFDEANTGFVS
jgi:hypothetical protein